MTNTNNMTPNTEYTIRNISILTNKGEKWELCLGSFLDRFYKATNEEKLTMITESPLNMETGYHVPFLAAMAHKLSNDNNLTPPNWVFEKRCYLSFEKSYFAFNTKNTKLRLYYMYISPPEFKHRGLFLTQNVLTRI